MRRGRWTQEADLEAGWAAAADWAAAGSGSVEVVGLVEAGLDLAAVGLGSVVVAGLGLAVVDSDLVEADLG